jgi:hypothetical protein
MTLSGRSPPTLLHTKSRTPHLCHFAYAVVEYLCNTKCMILEFTYLEIIAKSQMKKVILMTVYSVQNPAVIISPAL